jgi:hypothetical protein
MANWLDKYEQGGMVLKKKTKDNYGKKANPNNVQASVGPDFVGLGYNIKGRNYSPAWGGQFAMGGNIPGAVGFTYARTQNPAPSNGKYAKKTKASAQNGQEMKFYQEGLDFTPKTISQNGLIMDRFKEEKAPSDATRVAAPIRPLTKKEQEENVRINKQTKKNTEAYNKQILDERAARRTTKGDVNVPGSFNIAEKARLFPESVGGLGEMFDEYINPAYTVGGLADALGESIAADSPGGVAATLAMTAGLGALGFDPLGSAMKAQRFSRGAIDNLGYNIQTAGFSGQGPRPTVQPTNLELNAIRQQRLNNAVTQGSQSSRVPYQFPTDEELLAWNTAEANRYYRRPSEVTPPAPSTLELDPIEEYYQRNPRPFTPRIPTEEELAALRREIPVDREVQSNLQRAADDLLRRIRGESSTSITPAPAPQPMSERLQRALRDVDTEPSVSDFISEDDLVEPAPAPYLSVPSSEPIEKQWDPNKFRIGQGDQTGKFVTKHPEGHYISEDVEVYDSGQAMRTYDISDANSRGQHIQIRTTQKEGDPYVDVRDVSFFNRDPKSSSKQMNIVFSHLPEKVRIEPISTSIHSQPLLNTRVAKLSSGQPGRIQIEPLTRMSSLNQITRSGFSPDAWYTEIIDQFPKLERTYKTINEYTGSELPMPYIKYKGNPISFEEFKSPDFKRQVMDAGNLFDIDVMVNKYKTIKNWKNGGQIVDPMGQWAHPGKTTVIPSNDITMKGVNYDVLGISNTGDKKLMKPGKNYKFDGDYVTEYPKGGWLNKYK